MLYLILQFVQFQLPTAIDVDICTLAWGCIDLAYRYDTPTSAFGSDITLKHSRVGDDPQCRVDYRTTQLQLQHHNLASNISNMKKFSPSSRNLTNFQQSHHHPT